MAATNFTPISLYYSTTASAVPLAGNLVAGELALNTLDEKLYFKNSAGTVKLLASNATSSPVLSFSAGTTGFTPSTATTGAVTLAGTLGTANGGTNLTSFTSGGVVYASSSSALATGSGLVFDGANLGVGVTPSAWASDDKALQIGGNGAFYAKSAVGATKSFSMMQNAYDATSGFTYISTDFASRYNQISGQHQWYTAASGTAGNAITFTQAMTLNASGKLLIGSTSSPSSSQIQLLLNSSSANGGLQLNYGAGTGGGAITGANGAGLIFYSYTGAIGSESYTERAKIDSSGNLGVGTSDPGTPLGSTRGIVINSGAAGGTQFRLQSTATGATTTDGILLSLDSTTNGYLWNYENGNLFFGTNNTQRFNIGSAGQFGIGATPSYGNAGEVLTSGGSSAAPTWAAAGGGSQAFVAFGSTGGF